MEVKSDRVKEESYCEGESGGNQSIRRVGVKRGLRTVNLEYSNGDSDRVCTQLHDERLRTTSRLNLNSVRGRTQFRTTSHALNSILGIITAHASASLRWSSRVLHMRKETPCVGSS